MRYVSDKGAEKVKTNLCSITFCRKSCRL